MKVPAIELTNLSLGSFIVSRDPPAGWSLPSGAAIHQAVEAGALPTFREPIEPLVRWIDRARENRCERPDRQRDGGRALCHFQSSPAGRARRRRDPRLGAAWQGHRRPNDDPSRRGQADGSLPRPGWRGAGVQRQPDRLVGQVPNRRRRHADEGAGLPDRCAWRRHDGRRRGSHRRGNMLCRLSLSRLKPAADAPRGHRRGPARQAARQLLGAHRRRFRRSCRHGSVAGPRRTYDRPALPERRGSDRRHGRRAGHRRTEGRPAHPVHSLRVVHRPVPSPVERCGTE